MGDYLEEILDSNDLEMELMDALDHSEMLGDSEYQELYSDNAFLDNLEEGHTYE